MRWLISVAVLLSYLPAPSPDPIGVKKMKVTSSAFQPGKPIPHKHSAYGDNISPPLNWGGAPAGTKSFALIMDDPDAPRDEPFAHWVLYNIPASVKSFQEGQSQGAGGKNDRDQTGYFGPRPPSGVHHYHFKVYALDTQVQFIQTPTKAHLLSAIKGHVLAQGELIGTFAKP